MNSLERAKEFIARKACRLAVAVAPLAALAVSAPAAQAADVTFDVLDSPCNVFVGGGSCNTFPQSDTGGNPQANWIAIAGNVSSASGGTSWMVDLGVSGGLASGSLAAGAIPVSWKFLFDNSRSDVNWNVFFDILFSGGGTSSFSASGSSTPGSQINGGGMIKESGGFVIGYDIRFTANSPNSFSANIPMVDSIDLNSPVGAPEPASVLLMAPGAALLILRRRKKRA
jgi:hypothetical protein